MQVFYQQAQENLPDRDRIEGVIDLRGKRVTETEDDILMDGVHLQLVEAQEPPMLRHRTQQFPSDRGERVMDGAPLHQGQRAGVTCLPDHRDAVNEEGGSKGRGPGESLPGLGLIFGGSCGLEALQCCGGPASVLPCDGFVDTAVLWSGLIQLVSV